MRKKTIFIIVENFDLEEINHFNNLLIESKLNKKYEIILSSKKIEFMTREDLQQLQKTIAEKYQCILEKLEE